MGLTAGQSLLQYRLAEPIGEGGMGVVWRATDTALGRDAAIKILPDLFAQDAERLARFEREAKLLASLSHPNIAAVYGLHLAQGVRFLAMEMVRGEDLAARLSRGPLPVDEALALGRQIAEALETAHENGVIHRDLKPANVRVTPEGMAKVLDFGLAKAFDVSPASGSAQSGLSPTMTSAGSVAGLILGTAAYMSPEQARGKPVDRRTDIWSFGCVMYEMLTGRRPFEGETISDSIAKILQTEADLTKLPAATPKAAREMIARCLEKDAKRRLRDMGDARLALEDALRAGAEPAAAAVGVAPVAGRRAWLPWSVAGLAVAAAALSLVFVPRSGTAAVGAKGAKFLALNAPEGLRFDDHAENMAIAPDGRSIVVAAAGADGTTRLHLRKLDDPAWRTLPGTDGAYFPFWSPDGRFVGFFASTKMKRVAVGGGTADPICDAAAGRGATWSPDGVILFAPSPAGPLMQVKAEGGAVTPATELDVSRGEVAHRFPRFLPDGKRFLYATVPARDGSHESYLTSLGSKERTLVVNSGGVPAFASPDRLVYRRNSTLFVQSFDPGSAQLSGEPRALVEAGEATGFMAAPTASVAGTGVLAFVPLVDADTVLTWFGMDGIQGETIPLPPKEYTEVRFSPDGSRVATASFERGDRQIGGSDIWLVDPARSSASRVTFDAAFEFAPVWSPDGRFLYFNGNQTGPYLIYRIPAEGAGEPVALTKGRGLTQQPDDITPDGRHILYETQEAKTGLDLQIVDLSNGSTSVYLSTPANERDARLSPDGRWAAYTSNESGHEEIYIQSFPTPGRKVQVSNGGGRLPDWGKDGRRLYYVVGDALTAADVTPGEVLRVGVPVKLFQFPHAVVAYDVTRDGKRLLASLNANDAAGRSIGLILDWDAAGK